VLPIKNKTCWKYNAFVHDNTERIKTPEKNAEANSAPANSANSVK